MIKTCVLLKTGTCNGTTITREFLQSVVDNFKECPLMVGFTGTVLDGHVGHLTSVDLKDDTLYGVYEIPDWLANLINPDILSVGIAATVATSKIVKAALI